MNKIYNKLKYLINIYILKDRFTIAAKEWFKDEGDNNLRLNYQLNESSIVFDVGGYHGDFTDKIYKKYKSNIYIFEPVEIFYNIINNKILNNKKIHLYKFGLSNSNSFININISDDASSIFGEEGKKEKIELKSVINFINNNNIKKIDLFKINIEGGEFDVLPALIDSGYIHKIKNIQIQFHNFIDNANSKRDKIRQELKKTHHLTYDYYFIWENWVKNE